MPPPLIPHLTVHRRHRRALARAACLAYLSVGATLVLIVFGLSLVFSWRPVVVLGGSMAPALEAGDVLLLDRSVDRAALDVGSIVTFEDPVEGRLVTHRVTAANEDGTYQTAGDANPEGDTAALDIGRIRGRARVVVPSIGMPLVWAEVANWLALAAGMTATALAVWGARCRAGCRPVRRERAGAARRPVAVASASVLALAALARGTDSALDLSRAVFSGTTTNPGNLFQGASSFGGLGSGGSNATTYRSTVAADSPFAHWRLGESGNLVLFQDDFETFTGWTDLGTGTFRSSSARAYSGTSSGIKDTSDDPNGGWKPLGTTVGNEWILEAWLYRPSGYLGGAADRMMLEDGSGNGYGFSIGHSGNDIRIHRRSGGSVTSLASKTYNAPEDTWFRVVLIRSGSSLSLTLYATDGSFSSDLYASDSTHSSFDRVTVRGGYAYHVDDVRVSRPAADAQGPHGAQYSGGPQLGADTLIFGDTDTAVRFDGVDDALAIADHPNINAADAGYAARTVELWFSADSTASRQVLWEEGGGTNGMSLYLESGTLYARAWSETNAWTNDLQATTTVSAGTRYQAVAVLDAVGGTLRLYLDGSLRATSTKGDTTSLAKHTDNGAIGAALQVTEFHDGDSNGSWGQFFAGVIDEVALYNSALSASQVFAHYRAGR